MNQEQRASLIRRYSEGYDAVVVALEGASDADLDRRGAEGWSAREVVHHLADSEMTSAIRLRRLLAEDSPEIAGYDEAEFARRLFYRERPIEPSLAAFKSARDSTVPILQLLGEEQWRRAGTHSESGPYSVEAWLEIYAQHAFDHAAQIGRALGRPEGEEPVR